MKLSVTTEHRFEGLPDGTVWTPSSFAYSFWTRYLEVFDAVRIISRVIQVERIPDGWLRIDGDSVEIAPVPFYHGPIAYLRRKREISKSIAHWCRPGEAVVLRVASPIATIAAAHLRRRGHPYGVEVLGDPWDVFARGVVRHPLRPFLRRWFVKHMRQQCREACAVAYVTREALQRRYPATAHAPGEEARAFAVSDVQLNENSFRTRQKHKSSKDGQVQIITVGSLEQPYKGVDVLLRAIQICRARGLNVVLSVVGEGKYRRSLERLSRDLNLQDHVRFLGQIPGFQAVALALDGADLFVLASLTEGLPRALLEAMARGLPCIGSAVGGIPELIGQDCLAAPGDARGLARRIGEVVTDPARMARLSEANSQVAREYSEDRLRERRVQFLKRVRSSTEEWCRSGVDLVPA